MTNRAIRTHSVRALALAGALSAFAAPPAGQASTLAEGKLRWSLPLSQGGHTACVRSGPTHVGKCTGAPVLKDMVLDVLATYSVDSPAPEITVDPAYCGSGVAVHISGLTGTQIVAARLRGRDPVTDEARVYETGELTLNDRTGFVEACAS